MVGMPNLAALRITSSTSRAGAARMGRADGRGPARLPTAMQSPTMQGAASYRDSAADMSP